MTPAALEQQPYASTLVALAMFFPALSMLLTRFITREGFSHMMFRPHPWRNTWRLWVAGAFGLTIPIVGIAGLWFLLNPGDFDLSASTFQAQLALSSSAAGLSSEALTAQMPAILASQIIAGVLVSPFINIVTTSGEEWGWRGYLLPKLVSKVRILPALIASGCIWGLWH